MFFRLFEVAFVVMMIGIIVAMVLAVVRSRKNSTSPVVVVPARLVAKRQDFSGNSGMTRYFVTFELETGSRIEFGVDAPMYGQSAEGDFGQLSFQGTRFLWFQRQLGMGPATDLR